LIETKHGFFSLFKRQPERVALPQQLSASEVSCSLAPPFPCWFENMLASFTERLRAGSELTRDEVALACDHLFDEEIALASRADFLRALHNKGETPAEIAAFVDVLLDRGVVPDLGEGLLDVCGTGGDRAGLINVSTGAMFVAAACGVRVVKHGNRGITSKCGGADVLEALGIRLDLPPQSTLASAGCCFLFAPLYHPAFKAVAPVRSALAAEGTATVFNLLGPLLNPARPDFQLAGVFDPKLLPVYAEAFHLLGRKRAWAVHGSGGFDEVSTLGPSEVHAAENGRTQQFFIDPGNLGFTSTRMEELRGGDVRQNSELLENILRGRERGPKRDIILLNAACALVVAGVSGDLGSALEEARLALDKGLAYAVLRRLREIR
jgi:anthranilate phosphoribosyltransferase